MIMVPLCNFIVICLLSFNFIEGSTDADIEYWADDFYAVCSNHLEDMSKVYKDMAKKNNLPACADKEFKKLLDDFEDETSIYHFMEDESPEHDDYVGIDWVKFEKFQKCLAEVIPVVAEKVTRKPNKVCSQMIEELKSKYSRKQV